MVLDAGWSGVKRFLPFSLDDFAVETGALQRRRGVRDGECLVRSLLLCALPKLTYHTSAQIAREANISELSGQALFKRMVDAEALMNGLFMHVLKHAASPSECWAGRRLLAVDATTLCGPGSKGTDQRLHIVYDLGKGLPVSAELTDRRGGESFKRHHSFGQGDLVLADACYGVGPGLQSLIRSGANFLVRFNFETIRLLGEDDQKIWLEQADAILPAEGYVDFCVYLPDCVIPLRVIGGRNNKGKGVWLITDLGEEDIPRDEARALYSRRWQIELFFKRMKSLIDLDELPSRNGPGIRPWIWTKLLLAALAALLADERFSPWESEEEESLEELSQRALAAA